MLEPDFGALRPGWERPDDRKPAATSLTLWKRTARASVIQLMILTGDYRGLNLQNEMV